MLTPDYQTFLQLSRESTLVPVAKTLSADLLTPVAAFLSIAAQQKYAFLLESVEGGEKIGRYTFLGAEPRTVITARRHELTVREGIVGGAAPGQCSRAVARAFAAITPATLPGLPPFTSGGVGYFAYDMVRQFERLPERAKDDLGLPDCVFTFYDRLLAFDHLRHRCTSLPPPMFAQNRRARPTTARSADIAAIERKLARGVARPASPLVRQRQEEGHKSPQQHFARSTSSRACARAKEYIAAGDIFQVVLSQRLDFKPPAEPFQIYRALRTVNPSPYMFFLKLDDMHVAGSVAGNAGEGFRTQAGVSPDCGHAQAWRRCCRRRAPDRSNCATTRKNAPST